MFITDAALRIGNGDKPIDNYSAGGLAAEINIETGLVVSRYIGWDVVVCDDGGIQLIEVNTCAGVKLQQHPGLHEKKNYYASFMARRKK